MTYTWRKIEASEFPKLEAALRVAHDAEAFFTLGKTATAEELTAYWFGGIGNEVWGVEENGVLLGMFYQRANQAGLASHTANGGYVVFEAAKGKGIGRLMGEKSIERAKERGFKAIQFNFVVATNTVAVRLWRSLGFIVIGTIPKAYHYKHERYDDALIMHREIL